MPRVVEVTHSYGNLAESKPGYLAERKPGYCYVSNVLMSGPPCWVNPGNRFPVLIIEKAKVTLSWRKAEIYLS